MKPFACLLLLVLKTVATVSAASPFRGWSNESSDEWTGWGGSIFNNRWSTSKHVSSSSLKNITVHCQIPHAGGVSATPTLHNGTAFYPTWGGTIVALDYDNCQVQWEINVTAIIVNFKPPTAFQIALTKNPITEGILSSRTSPQTDKQTGVLYFATQLNALVVAIDVKTGALLGVTQINTHEAAVVTLSPTLYEGILYAGVSSLEELVAGVIEGYKCCSFVGNAVALQFDRSTGRFKKVWNLDMLPPRNKYSNGSDWAGAGVWGSQPAIDPDRRRVFFGTGNVYTAPDQYLNCTDEKFSPTTTAQNTSCLPERVWQNAVLAADLLTGKVAWVKRFGPLDVWNLACGVDGVGAEPSCSWKAGPDFDFGMAPTFVPAGRAGGYSKDVLTIGQKSGYLYSLDADTGEIQWATATSPGGVTGGLSWGVATDDRRVYFTGINSGARDWTVQPGYGATVNNSVWGAASLSTGSLLWETVVADNLSSLTPPTVVGDVVLVGRVKPTGPITSEDGPLVVLAKDTGKVLLEFPLKGTLRGGVAVQDRYILFGTGYKGLDGYLYVIKT